MPILPQPLSERVGISTTAQAADDDNIINYRDITFNSGFATHAQPNTINIRFPAIKVTNISYNKITKQLFYDIAPGAAPMNIDINWNNNTPPGQSHLWNQKLTIDMCGSAYTEAGYEREKTDYTGWIKHGHVRPEIIFGVKLRTGALTMERSIILALHIPEERLI